MHFWVQYHFKTDQGIKNLTREEAGRLCSTDADHATRDVKALKLDIKEVKRLAGLSQDERAKATVEGSYK